MNKIRVLVIATYEGLASLCQSLIEMRDNFEADIFVAGLDDAVQLVKNTDLSKYNAIISRGGTCKMIADVTNMPVISIDISGTDILKIFQLVKNVSTQYAFVGHKDLVANLNTYCSLLQIKQNVYEVNDMEHAKEEITKLKEEGYRFIIGDGSGVEAAKALGLRNLLITSGPESINYALDKCEAVCRAIDISNMNHYLLKEVIKSIETFIFVFDTNKNIIYTNISNSDYFSNNIIEKLKVHILSTIRDEISKFYLVDNRYRWHVNANSIHLSGIDYAVFYISPLTKKVTTKIDYFKVEAYCQDKFDRYMAYNNSSEFIFTILENMGNSPSNLFPIIIWGEPGSGRDTLAYAIYASGPQKGKPLIIIECDIIGDQAWDYLLEDPNSPLYENDNTIFFSNISTLSIPVQFKLYDFIQSTSFITRNRVITSFLENPVEQVCSKKFVQTLYNELNSFTIFIPPLRERISEIPLISACYINEMNQLVPTQVIGFEPNAIELIKEFDWPYNFFQLKQVIMELVTSAKSSLISEDEVHRALSHQSPMKLESVKMNNIDLQRPLFEIDKEIINMVLLEEDMNQTKAAKRLKISRSTMWRKLKG